MKSSPAPTVINVSEPQDGKVKLTYSQNGIPFARVTIPYRKVRDQASDWLGEQVENINSR